MLVIGIPASFRAGVGFLGGPGAGLMLGMVPGLLRSWYRAGGRAGYSYTG